MKSFFPGDKEKIFFRKPLKKSTTIYKKPPKGDFSLTNVIKRNELSKTHKSLNQTIQKIINQKPKTNSKNLSSYISLPKPEKKFKSSLNKTSKNIVKTQKKNKDENSIKKIIFSYVQTNPNKPSKDNAPNEKEKEKKKEKEKEKEKKIQEKPENQKSHEKNTTNSKTQNTKQSTSMIFGLGNKITSETSITEQSDKISNFLNYELGDMNTLSIGDNTVRASNNFEEFEIELSSKFNNISNKWFGSFESITIGDKNERSVYFLDTSEFKENEEIQKVKNFLYNNVIVQPKSSMTNYQKFKNDIYKCLNLKSKFA